MTRLQACKAVVLARVAAIRKSGLYGSFGFSAPRFPRASRSSTSIWALTERSSAAANFSTAAITSGLTRNRNAFLPGEATQLAV